jgi:uncharacterized cofD-like protein
MGGGTGLAALLNGLKRFPEPTDLTAVVTVTDDGGSSGRLRREFDVLPPGDIRNCMVAMSQDETLLSRLFQYRFTTGRGLKGHSFGNLFLTALTNVTGDFAKAVRISSAVLPIRGRIFPCTETNVQLEAELENGRRVAGETKISKSRSPISLVHLKPRRCKPMQGALEAIAEADLISFGPGSLYTSVIPNLLVEGIPEAVRKSRAVKAYFVNLMWQPGETMHYTAADHIQAIEKHAGKKLIDYVVVNTRPISPALRRKYGNQQVSQVENDLERLARMGLAIVARDLLEQKTTVRHNPAIAAAVAVQLAQEGRRGRIRG